MRPPHRTPSATRIRFYKAGAEAREAAPASSRVSAFRCRSWCASRGRRASGSGGLLCRRARAHGERLRTCLRTPATAAVSSRACRRSPCRTRSGPRHGRANVQPMRCARKRKCWRPTRLTWKRCAACAKTWTQSQLGGRTSEDPSAPEVLRQPLSHVRRNGRRRAFAKRMSVLRRACARRSGARRTVSEESRNDRPPRFPPPETEQETEQATKTPDRSATLILSPRLTKASI